MENFHAVAKLIVDLSENLVSKNSKTLNLNPGNDHKDKLSESTLRRDRIHKRQKQESYDRAYQCKDD